jgi:hypothetical protein|tara:strand:- start:1538 stop:1699 length:162 start_codon:yes stop_codon:yes gene_type:complete
MNQEKNNSGLSKLLGVTIGLVLVQMIKGASAAYGVYLLIRMLGVYDDIFGYRF